VHLPRPPPSSTPPCTALRQQVAALSSQRPPQFEAALSVCEHFHALSHKLRQLNAMVADLTATPSAGLTAFSPLDALGGVNETKIRQIRAQFGYQLFARGDFKTSLHHLANAREPVSRVLSLFPQLLPSWFHRRAAFPVRMPLLLDHMLAEAIRPLIPYLHSQRRRLRCDTRNPDLAPEVAGAADDVHELTGDEIAHAVEGEGVFADSGLAGVVEALTGEVDVLHLDAGAGAGDLGGGGSGKPSAAKATTHARTASAAGVNLSGDEADGSCSSLLSDWTTLIGGDDDAGGAAASPAAPVVPAVLVDTVLLITYLWMEVYLVATLTTIPAAGTAAGTATTESHIRRLRSSSVRLLSGRNCVDLHEAELQLAAFGKAAGVEAVGECDAVVGQVGGGAAAWHVCDVHSVNVGAALYQGKGLHARAVELVIGSVTETLRFVPAAHANLVIVPHAAPHPTRVVAVARMLALSTYLTSLPATPAHGPLLRSGLSFLLSGKCGTIGCVVALHTLLCVTVGEAALALTSLASAADLLQSVTLGGDAYLWRVRGDVDLPGASGVDERALINAYLSTEEVRVTLQEATDVCGGAATAGLVLVAAFLSHHVLRQGCDVPTVQHRLQHALLSIMTRWMGPLGRAARAAGQPHPAVARLATAPGPLGHYRRRFTAALSACRHVDASALLAALDAAAPMPISPSAAGGGSGGARPVGAVARLTRMANGGAAGTPPVDSGDWLFVEERIALLRALGDHDQALWLCVNVLRDNGAAEAYCDAVVAASAVAGAFSAEAAQVSQVYTALLQTYVRRGAGAGGGGGGRDVAKSTSSPTVGPPGDGDTLGIVVPFLVSNLSRVDIPTAVALIPDTTPLATIATLLSSALQVQADRAQLGVVAHALADTQAQAAAAKLVDRQTAEVAVMDRGSTCAACGKRLAAGGEPVPFVKTVKGAMLHLACA